MKRISALLTTAMALMMLPALALTDESTTLQAIMQGLRDNLVEIADGRITNDRHVRASGIFAAMKGGWAWRGWWWDNGWCRATGATTAGG